MARQLPKKFKALIEQYETEIRAELGDAIYDRLVEGRYRPIDFLNVRRFLATLISN